METGTFRRPLNTSCWMCRKRKVRCDATDNEPCSSCKRTGVTCRPYPNQLEQSRARRNRSMPASTPPMSEHMVQAVDGDDAHRPGSPSMQTSPIDVPSCDSGNLSRFFEAGLISSNWDRFEEHGTFRNVYIGTDVANLHHLVRDHESPWSGCLSYPFPAIRKELGWKPRPGVPGYHYLTADAINDLSNFPVRPVRDALVETYFQDIHPGFPIIDEAEFRRQYGNPGDAPPLLVLQAVLLAAARISTHPQVAASRATTTATLFRRAKSLFDLRYENDRVDLIQAALLLAWYTESSDNVASNAYYWVGNAVRIGFGMGLHRNASLRYVPAYRRRFSRKYKKIWWSLLYSEVMLALEYGRPSTIRTDDFDVGLLVDDDFRNMDDSEDELVNRQFCAVLSDLSLVALDVLSLRSPRAKDVYLVTASIENRFAAIAMRIPAAHSVWSCQLRLVYNLTTLIFYRTSGEAYAMKLCSEAASNILTTLEAMVVQGTIRQCHLSCTTTLMGAAIQFARDVKWAAAEKSVIKAISAHGQLERLLAPAEALLPYFTQIEAVCRLCKSLTARAARLIRELQDQLSPTSSSQAAPAVSIDWEDIMTNNRMMVEDFRWEGEEWLNDFSLADGDPGPGVGRFI